MKRDGLIIAFTILINAVIFAIQWVAHSLQSNRAELTRPYLWIIVVIAILTVFSMVRYIGPKVQKLDERRDANLVQAFKQALKENNVELAQTLKDVLGKGDK